MVRDRKGSAYGGRPTVFQPVLNNTLKPVGRRLAETLTAQEKEQKSPPELTDHHRKAQGLRTALNASVGGRSATEALRKTIQD